MEIKIKTGIEHQQSEEVVYEKTAASFGSGLVEVYASPAMISLMEKTCMQSIMPFLPSHLGTVGTLVNVKHIKATPIGKIVSCKSKLIEVDNKKLVFEVKAYDNEGVIGKGIHERFIIDTKKFISQINM